MKKKTITPIAAIIIIAIVAIRFYRKYDRQQTLEEKQQKQREIVWKYNKKRDSLERVKQDSIKRVNYKTRLDSMQEENKKKLKEIQEIMKKLEKEN